METVKSKSIVSYIVLILGFLSIIFYFLHVILGTINYPGYDSLSQAVSDLTSDDSPAKAIARTFSSIYGIFSSLVSLGLFFAFKSEKSKILKTGIYLLATMYLTSAIGYSLFPLANTGDISNFQNIMHIVVTILVVLLTIISMIILMISYKKQKLTLYLWLTIITFTALMFGAFATNIISPDYFGLAERFSVFSVVIYLGVISYFNYDYHKKMK